MSDRFVITGMPGLSEIVADDMRETKDMGKVAVTMVAAAVVLAASDRLTESEQVPASLVKELATRHEEYLDDAGLAITGMVSLFGPKKKDLIMQAINHVFAVGYQRGWQAAVEGETTPVFVEEEQGDD